MAFLIRAIFSFFYSIFNLFRFSILTLEDDARAECDHSLHFLEVSNWIQEHNGFEAIFQIFFKNFKTPWSQRLTRLNCLFILPQSYINW